MDVSWTNGIEIVVGVTGLKASGKDELSRWLTQQYGFASRRFSDTIREEAMRRGITDPSTALMQDIGDEMRKRSTSEDFLAVETLAAAVRNGARKVVVNGIRNPTEIESFKRLLGSSFVLVGIVAPIEIRIARFLKRGQAGDPKELAEFLRIDDRDRGVGQPAHGQQVDRCLALVPWERLYNNAGTLPEFHAWIDRLASSVLPS